VRGFSRIQSRPVPDLESPDRIKQGDGATMASGFHLGQSGQRGQALGERRPGQGGKGRIIVRRPSGLSL